MNKILYKLLSIFAVLALLVSCNMDRMPKGSMAADESLLSIEDAQNWKNAMMTRLRNAQGNLFNMVADIQADQLSATTEDGNHYSGSRTWSSVNSADYDRRDVWVAHYLGIKNINYTIEKLEGFTPNDDQVAIYNNILGTAYFLRAYHYADLALRYATPYKKETASQDLGLPLALVYDPQAKLPRATNEETYNQILNVDLAKAKSLLAGTKGVAMSDEITIDCVYALEARTKLYMGDWQGAFDAATTLINSGTYPLVAPVANNFVDMWVNDKSSEEILQLFSSRPDELVGIQYYFGARTDRKRSNGSNGVNVPSHIPTQWMLDLYPDTDLRKGVYFSKQECNVKDYFFDLYLVAKRKGSPELAATTNPAFTFWNGYVPNGIHKPKVFRIAEQYLIAAEAACHLGKDAKLYLNPLRISRGLPPVTSSGDALLNDVKDERTRELAFEGFRLWDLRRWQMPMKRHHPQIIPGSSGEYLKMDYADNYEFPATDHRFVWPIPYNDLTTGGVVQNPGW